ncbi:MAG TPA: PAAR domain-containing protein [Pyrinomonadaceae bacterium]|nr:PAAR domain-containing protein [Pyrinomonadaceae bacterium]
MGQPAAKQGDQVTAVDMHLIQPPGPTSPVIVPHPFSGIIDNGLSANVNIESRPAATLNSTATNTPPHIPIGGTFVKPPSNQARITVGSPTVLINNKPAARSGDTALTCNDPVDLPAGTVVAVSTVLIG